MSEESELRLEALRLAVSKDRLGKSAQQIVEEAEAFYHFLRGDAPRSALKAA